jgi:hypothetical protein
MQGKRFFSALIPANSMPTYNYRQLPIDQRLYFVELVFIKIGNELL